MRITGTLSGMSARILIANAAWSVTCHLLTRGSLMLSALLLARRMPTSSFAAYSYYQLTVSMLATYAAMGLGVAASKFFAKAAAADSEKEVPALGTLSALSGILAGLGSLAVFFMPAAWITAGLGVPRWLIAVGVLVLAIQVVPGGAIVGLERYREAAAIAAGSGVISVVGALLAIQAQNESVAMLALMASACVQSSGEAAVAIRAIGWRRIAVGFRLRRSTVMEVLAISGPMFLASLLAGSGAWLVGRIILAGPGGEREFALFTIGLQWFALALFLPGMVSRVMLPRLVRAESGGAGGVASRQIVRLAVAITVSVAAAVAMSGVLLAPWILRLYGDRYVAGGRWISAYLIAGVVSAPANSVLNALLARNGQWLWLALTILWAVVLIVAAYGLRSFGPWGGGATYIIAYGTLTVGALLVARNHSLV